MKNVEIKLVIIVLIEIVPKRPNFEEKVWKLK